MSNLPVPIERTWSTNDLATAALLNSNLRDGLNFLLNVPLCLTTQGTGQSLTSTTFTPIAFDTNVIDTYSGHSTTVNNSRYTAVVSGYYLALATVNFGSNAGAGQRSVGFQINGGGIITNTQSTVPSGSIGFTALTTAHLAFLNVGDYIETLGYQSTGGSLTTLTAGMRIMWMHA